MEKKPLPKRKPLRPFVTLEKIEAFDSKRPETYTCSPLVNAVLEAIDHLPACGYWHIPYYLDLDSRTLSTCLKVATGMTLTELRMKYVAAKFKRLREEHPDYSPDEQVSALGYSSRSAIWSANGRKRRDPQKPPNTKRYRELEQLRQLAEQTNDKTLIELYERLRTKFLTGKRGRYDI